MASLRQTRKDGGLCIKCGEPRHENDMNVPKAERGTSLYCRRHAREHSQKQAARNAQSRAEWRRKKYCSRCGRPPKKTRKRGKRRKTCYYCRLESRKYVQSHRGKEGSYA
jgi:hypothetical protein